MNVEPLISFGGRCEEALEFCKKAVGAEVTALMRWKGSVQGHDAGDQSGRRC